MFFKSTGVLTIFIFRRKKFIISFLLKKKKITFILSCVAPTNFLDCFSMVPRLTFLHML